MCGVWSSGADHVFQLICTSLFPLISALCNFINLQDAHWYASFSEMLGAESLAKVLPGVETIEEGKKLRTASFIEFHFLYGDKVYPSRQKKVSCSGK